MNNRVYLICRMIDQVAHYLSSWTSQGPVWVKQLHNLQEYTANGAAVLLDGPTAKAEGWRAVEATRIAQYITWDTGSNITGPDADAKVEEWVAPQVKAEIGDVGRDALRWQTVRNHMGEADWRAMTARCTTGLALDRYVDARIDTLGLTVNGEALPSIDIMVNRFLTWELPRDFSPDCGIEFTPLNHPHSWPVGTNLFTAMQTEAMLRYVMGNAIEPEKDNE